MEPIVLELGELRAELEDGGLRYLTCQGTEIVRGIYAAVRDRDWGTVTPRIEDLQITEADGGKTVRFRSVHAEGDIDFIWNGTIRMEPGRLRFDFEGEARSSFLKNRIGFCVLHPMSFAGLPVEMVTMTGRVQGKFPERISPHQPFKEIKEMSYAPVSGMRVRMVFEGDVFEMEDQRNWTDASYKTYCTPLELPFPVRVEAGQQIRQSIEIRIAAEPGAAASGNRTDVVRVEVGSEFKRKLPGIGFMLPDGEPGERERDWLKQLRPSHVRLVLDLSADGWRTKMESAVRWAALYGCGIELELLTETDERLRELARLIGSESWPIRRVLPFRPGKFVSDKELIRSVKQAFGEAGLSIPVGGGTRTYYAEHNRASLPLEDMDFTAYSINPQVHAFDDRSLMETVFCQPVTAADAAAKTGLPLHIGPITLKPRINPKATSGDGSIGIADQADERQSALFGAAWTLGSVAAMSLEGTEALQSLTYYELFGPIGLVNGQANPLYVVFRDLTEDPAAELTAVSRSSDRVAALALRSGSRLRVLLANLTGAGLETEITAGAYASATVRVLDEQAMESLRSEPSAAAAARPAGKDSETVPVTLGPYAYACVDFDNGREA